MYYQNAIMATYFKRYDSGESSYNHIYNNTYWYNGHDTSQSGKSNWVAPLTHAMYFNDTTSTDENIIKNNIFYNNNNQINQNWPMIEEYNSGTGWNEPDLQYISNNWIGSIDGDPMFSNINGTPDPTNETQFDFALTQGSGAIDKGAFLTTITSPNGSGTKFTVTDAGYFFDGWGLTSHPTANIIGDRIQLQGQSTNATITNVDYATNTITLDTPLTWINGQGVGLIYYGNSPDLGAKEFTGSSISIPLPTPKPTGATVK